MYFNLTLLHFRNLSKCIHSICRRYIYLTYGYRGPHACPSYEQFRVHTLAKFHIVPLVVNLWKRLRKQDY